MTDDIVTALRIVADRFSDKLGPKNLMSEAADEIDRLRVNLDDARREVCIFRAVNSQAETPSPAEAVVIARKMAEERGWKCFAKKATP
jgi:hypothetical protein